MDIGNSKIPYTYDEYKTICLSSGLTSEWHIELSYKMYLAYFSGNDKKAGLIYYYNTLYFNEGSLN